MDFCRKTILLLIFSSIMSVGWGQSHTDNYTQEIINISDDEVMIISNHEMEGYTFSDTTYISVSRLFPPCDEGYTEIDGECYYQSDLDVLQEFIDNSQGGVNPPPSDLSPIDLGEQVWGNGRLIDFCSSGYIEYSTNCLVDYTLSGEIPENIDNLTSLWMLELMGNQLNGNIPESIGNLYNLEWLNLFDNELEGYIPESMGNLSNLIGLSLSNNLIEGILPISLTNLQNLQWLGLSSNNLTGQIPNELINLINLTQLDLSQNQLTGEIPIEICYLTNLTSLNLYNNQLTGVIPPEICNIGDSSRSLYNNQLCPPYPECLTEEDIGYQDTLDCINIGDVNGDFEINILDVVTLVNIIIDDGEYTEYGDMNYDGYLNILDVVTLVNFILDN